MKKEILVLDADEKECQRLCAMLQKKHYRTVQMHSLQNLEKYIQVSSCLAVILDLDTISIDNRVIRELVIKNPGLCILALSKDRFHPELKDAICYHIFACLNKPVDPDELFYWLRCIDENDSDRKYQPNA